MMQITMILFLFMWPLFSYQTALDFSDICGKCGSAPCPINVGLLAVLTGAEETALRQALTVINSHTFLYPNWEIRLTHLGRDNQDIFRDGSGQKLFRVIVDQLISNKLSILIGPESSVYVELIHPMLVMLNITHIAPLASNPTFLDPGRFPNLIRMVPDDNYQFQAVMSLLNYFHYTQVSLLTSDDEYGLSMAEIFRRHSYRTKEHEIIKVILLQIPTIRAKIRFNLQQIYKYKPHLVVLATDRLFGNQILTEAYRLNMTTPHGWLWLLTDVMTMVPVKNIQVNGKSLRFPELLGLRPRLDTHKVHEDLNMTHQAIISFTVERYIDSFLLVADRIKQTCKESKEMRNNNSLSIDYFHHRRSPLLVIYDVMTSNDTDWSVIGQWNSNNQSSMQSLNMTKGSRSIRPANRLKISTNFEDPFVYFENSNDTDPSKLRGYCVDLLKELSRLADFEYDIHVVKDRRWGIINESGQWDGMIGEVMRGEADLAATALTLTEERAQVVDFLPPFVRLELKFLIKRVFKQDKEYNAFAFLGPFDISLYQAILISVFSLAAFVSFLSTISPYGIRGSFSQSNRADAAKEIDERTEPVGLFIPRRTKKEKRLLNEREEAQRGMGLNNSLYLFWAALFSQSPERVPRSISAKIVAIAWYVASTVFVASYTANLVTSVSRFTQEVHFIRSPEDLLMQNAIQFGTTKGNAMENQLRISNTNLGKKLFAAIQSNKSTMGYWVTNTTRAYELVNAGKFAMIWDSLLLDLKAVESNCELKAEPLGFGSIQYAIAIQKSSTYYNLLATHLRAMKESGFLKMLWDKYFHKLENCNHLETSSPKSRQLTFIDLAGVFILTGVVMAIGFVLLGVEWIVAAFADTNSSRPNAPQTIREAFRIRRNRVSQDIRSTWQPLRSIAQSWSRASQADQLVQLSLRRQFSRRSGQLRGLIDIDSYHTDSTESSKTDAIVTISRMHAVPQAKSHVVFIDHPSPTNT